MERFNRAERRAQVERLKARRKNYWGYGRPWSARGAEPMGPKQLGRVVQYPQVCSCTGCGNQRRSEGPTKAERVQAHDLNEFRKGEAML